ncbi:MAG: histidine kinase dimerization/phospho-acceptor domain-containing protein [Thalassobaculaceae bacterium]
MLSVPLPSDETDRLAELIWYQILDTPPEDGFDRITRTASRLLDAPIALVSLVDKDRQWFKSKCGLAVGETPREDAFCTYTILQRTPLIVEDALADDRFRNNRLVVSEPRIRAYAGIPLVTESGFALGSLCVLDTRPRVFTDDQVSSLKDLAETVMDLMRYRLLEADVRHSASMFSAQISHEIRTPLNAVIGFSEALSSGLIAGDPARTGEYLAMISNASRDLDRILSRLLDASGPTDAQSGARSGA